MGVVYIRYNLPRTLSTYNRLVAPPVLIFHRHVVSPSDSAKGVTTSVSCFVTENTLLTLNASDGGVRPARAFRCLTIFVGVVV
jgi:hypothetical protein